MLRLAASRYNLLTFAIPDGPYARPMAGRRDQLSWRGEAVPGVAQMDQHLTEEEVAAFVFNETHRDIRINAHLRQCHKCGRVAHALHALVSEYCDAQAAPEPTDVDWDTIFQRILAGLARKERPAQ